MKYIAALLFTILSCTAVMICAGCETSKPERGRTESASTPSSVSQAQANHLIERAEQARDRTFEKRPRLEAVASSDELPAPPDLDSEVADERRLLIEQLFGQTLNTPDEARDDATGAAAPEPVFSHLAVYDSQEHRVVYLKNDAASDEREAAVLAALVQALDAEQFEAPPTPTSWDEQLALEAAKNATVSFALARYLLGTHHPDTDPDLLAARPELAGQLPVIADWLTANDADTFADKIEAREDAFVLREGWTLAAALYRSSGWSGVELGGLMPPAGTADVVRPDQWMAGEPVGMWSWPEDEGKAGKPQAGKIGPAVTSMWLEDVIDPRLARTVYAGYMSDAYRFFDQRKETPSSFEWLSVWNSPDAARQVAAAFEKRLRTRFDKASSPGEQYVVFQKGLKVGVIISTAPEETKRERAQTLLEEHNLSLQTRDGLPTSFVPTRQDQLLEAMQKATLDDRQWVDPATELRLDLSTLGEEWRVQQPDHGPVRWFASHPSGSLLQLTVELDNPLGPKFSTDAYRERLVEAFQQSLDQAKLDHVAPTDTTPSRGLLVRVSGQVDGVPRTLQLWQFERGDLIVSYSLQAPPEVFEDHRKLAKSILDDTRTIEAAAQSDDEPADEPSGSIEYEVED